MHGEVKLDTKNGIIFKYTINFAKYKKGKLTLNKEQSQKAEKKRSVNVQDELHKLIDTIKPQMKLRGITNVAIFASICTKYHYKW